MSKNEIERMHPLEIEVLSSMARTGKNGTPEELAEVLKINKDRLYKGLQLLADRGLVKEKIEKNEIIVQKEKARISAKKGLPERRLIDSLRRAQDIKNLAKNAGLDKDEFNVAFGLLKKRNIIEIKKGKVSLSTKGKIEQKAELDEEILLKRLDRGDNFVKNIPDSLLRTLENMKSRGLVAVEIQETRYYSLNNKGKEIADAAGKVKIIDQLNSKIISSGEWAKKDVKFRKYDINVEVPPAFAGKKQPYLAFLDRTKEWLVSRGFTEMEGPLVETAFWNSDALFMPQNHPARGIHDIYFLKNPKYGTVENKDVFKKVERVHKKSWKTEFTEKNALRLIMRSQGTALSARTLASNPKIPSKHFAIARVFRPDDFDATHLLEFNQAEGIIIGKNLNFRNLLGVLKDYALEVAGADEVWFRPGYFPFTEPSVEMDVKLGDKWLELGGAGLFRPEVVQPLLGKDVQVIAWGLGIDRMFMIRHKIKDIRYLFAQDIKWLRKEKVV